MAQVADMRALVLVAVGILVSMVVDMAQTVVGASEGLVDRVAIDSRLHNQVRYPEYAEAHLDIGSYCVNKPFFCAKDS